MVIITQLVFNLRYLFLWIATCEWQI